MMSKIKVTFEVDTDQLFDTLKKMEGDTGPLGARVLSALLTGDSCQVDRMGMAAYGITLLTPGAQ